MIPTMYVLDNTFSKRKANLAYRGTLSRRRPTGKASARVVDETSEQPLSAINLNLESPSDLSLLSDKNMGCDFEGSQNEVWRKIIFKTVLDNDGKIVVDGYLIY